MKWLIAVLREPAVQRAAQALIAAAAAAGIAHLAGPVAGATVGGLLLGDAARPL